MALISTVYPPEIWANESLLVLSDNLVMAPLVHRDFEAAIAQYGDKVHTRRPTKLGALNLAAQTGTDAGSRVTVRNLNAKDLSITLDTHKYVAYLISDRDAATSMQDLRQEFLAPAIIPLATAVDDDIVAEFCAAGSQDVDGNAVTAVADGTVGDGAAFNEDDIVAAMYALNNSQCPLDGRRLVLSSKHHADALKCDIFQQVSMSGAQSALRDATVGKAFGFETYMSQNVQVAADTDGTQQSLAFHRNAIALVVRPLAPIPTDLGARGYVASSGGLSIRVVEQYDQTYSGIIVKFEILYSVQLLDANLAKIVNP